MGSAGITSRTGGKQIMRLPTTGYPASNRRCFPRLHWEKILRAIPTPSAERSLGRLHERPKRTSRRGSESRTRHPPIRGLSDGCSVLPERQASGRRMASSTATTRGGKLGPLRARHRGSPFTRPLCLLYSLSPTETVLTGLSTPAHRFQTTSLRDPAPQRTNRARLALSGPSTGSFLLAVF